MAPFHSKTHPEPIIQSLQSTIAAPKQYSHRILTPPQLIVLPHTTSMRRQLESVTPRNASTTPIILTHPIVMHMMTRGEGHCIPDTHSNITYHTNPIAI